MSHVHYDATECPKDQFIQVMRDAHSVCRRWWLDELDCNVDIRRREVKGIAFEDALRYFGQDDAIPVVIERRYDFSGESYSEIGFHTLNSPSVFLWIIADAGFAANLGFPLR